VSNRTGNSDRTADPIDVLFVDDDRQWAQLVAEDIEATADDITVTIAGSVTDGLETFRDRDDIDCILSDYQMPGKDGLALLERVREANPRLPFLLVTSQGSELVAARATDAGVTDYLIKDAGADQTVQFVNKIEAWVEHHRLQQAIEESEERYRTVTEQSRDGIAIFRAGELRFCNERLLELTGRDRDTLENQDTVAEIVHRDDRDQVREVVDNWFEGDERSLLHEARIVQPDGTIRHCEYTGGQIEYRGAAATLVSIRDVTDRKQRERELEWERELNRTIQEALVESRSRDDLERTVTDQLQHHGYALAWVAERAGDVLVSRVVGGDRRYVDTIDWTLDSHRNDGEPCLRAVRTGDPQFQQRFGARSGEWAETATGYNYRSGAAIPLVYNEITYGVLAVYHGQPDRFDETERRLLTDLSDTVAFAIHSLETQGALAADQAVDVTLAVDDGYYLLDLARDGVFADYDEIQVVGTVPLDDDTVIQYVEADSDALLSLQDRFVSHPDVRDATGSGDGDSMRLQVTVTGPTPERRLAAQGIVVNTTTVENGRAIVEIELPRKEAVRSVVDCLEDRFGTVSARSVRDREHQPIGSDQILGTSTLTEKQLATLKAAYYEGYFAQPRTSTATEVAESLDVSHSTFLRHLRAAQEKLFSARFE
jgi:PAS domain S-box-containing protein